MPRQPRYCKLVEDYERELDSYIKRCHGNRKCSRLRLELRRELAHTLYTGRPMGKSITGRPLSRILRRIQRQIAADDYRLPRAWYEKCAYGSSKGTIAYRWKVHKREIRCLEDLWSDLEYGISEYRRLIRSEKVKWRHAVDELHEDVTILLDERAIRDTLLLALEAYAVPKGKGAPFTEVYGICFGSTRSNEERRRGHGKHTSRYVSVRGVWTQVRAEGFSNRVTYDLRSLDTQMTVVNYLIPQLDIVADFHTHPYDEVRHLLKYKGWRYSSADESTMPSWVAQLRSNNYHPVASLIMALAKGKRKICTPGKIRPNVVRFSVGKYHVYLAGYRICGDHYSDRNISINADALPGI